jgi:hypothetical protein
MGFILKIGGFVRNKSEVGSRKSEVGSQKLAKDFVGEGVDLMYYKRMTSMSAAKLITDREGGEWSLASFRQRIAKEFKKSFKKSEVRSQKSETIETIEKTHPNPSQEGKKNKNEAKPFEASAWNFETGKMMGIEEYCIKYNLPIDNVISYKLVTHTGTPFYNTLFKDVFQSFEVISNEFLEETISRLAKPAIPAYIRDFTSNLEWFDRLVYTDAHIGMDTDKDGIAMYASPWNKSVQLNRAKLMAEEVILNRKGSVLFIDELGDFMDGWNGYTVRQGHTLPQNMGNEQAFDAGISFKMCLIDSLMPYFDRLVFHNICNDNHSGSFGYVVNSAVKQICEAKYGDHIEITNHRQFINYYTVGKHAFVNTHGKDGKNLKFGFKPQLDTKQIEKIDAFLKHNKIYAQAEFIEFSKGDSHQMLLDYCTSDDFDYFNYPAFSPASEWVQTNFKKSRSGFVLQNVMYNENVKVVKPVWF